MASAIHFCQSSIPSGSSQVAAGVCSSHLLFTAILPIKFTMSINTPSTSIAGTQIPLWACVAAAGGALAAGTLLGRKLAHRAYRQAWAVPTTSNTPGVGTVSGGLTSPAAIAAGTAGAAAHASAAVDALADEQLSRHASFFGDAGHVQLRGAFVVVVGTGGVGSHCATMLARAGVAKCRIVDYDQVTLSSLNRHATATRADVGTPKVLAMQRYLQLAAPMTHVEAMNEMCGPDSIDRVLAGNPDYVLDCIDDRATKAHLLLECHVRGIKGVLSSLGAGGKSDPSQIRVTELKYVIRDPLAVKLRKKLHAMEAERGIPEGSVAEAVKVVYSCELPQATLLPLTAEQASAPHEFGAMPHFRVRTLPVLGPIPALFGQAMAAIAMTDLAGKPVELPEPAPLLRRKLAVQLRNNLLKRVTTKYGADDLVLTPDDVTYLTSLIWRQRCAVTGESMGAKTAKLALARWDPEQDVHPFNIVLVQTPVADRLDAEGRDWVDPAARERIEARLQLARHYYMGALPDSVVDKKTIANRSK